MRERQLLINWSPGKILALIIGIGWIVIQVIVPLYWLVERGFDPKPRQFGWQMYTNMAGGDRFQIISVTDQVREIDIDRFTHNVRPGLNYDEIFLDYLCRQFPRAKATKRISIDRTRNLAYKCDSQPTTDS